MNATQTQTTPPVFPIPQEMNLTGQRVSLTSAVIVATSDEDRFAAELLSRWVAEEFLVNLRIVEKASAGVTTIRLTTAGKPGQAIKVPAHAEGYALSIGNDGVTAIARD